MTLIRTDIKLGYLWQKANTKFVDLELINIPENSSTGYAVDWLMSWLII